MRWIPKIKRPGWEANQSLSSTSEVKNEWLYTSIPLVCLRGLVNHNFTCPPITYSLGPVNTLCAILLSIHFKAWPFRLVATLDTTQSGIATTLPSALCNIALCAVYHPFNVHATRISIRISVVHFWCPLCCLYPVHYSPSLRKKKRKKQKKYEFTFATSVSLSFFFFVL